MSFDKPSHSVPERHNPRMEVQEECLATIESELAAIQEKVTAGEPHDYDTHRIGWLVVERAKHAADQGDMEAAEKHLDFILQLPMKDGLAAETCCALIDRGSERAFDVLCTVLETEKTDAVKEIANYKKTTPLHPHSAAWAPGLEAVVTACEAGNILPDTWIETYAANEEHKWSLYADHYYRQAKSADNPAEFQQRLDAKVAELATDKFEPTFLHKQAAYALKKLEAPESRVQFLQLFKENTKVPLNSETFKDLVKVGTTVLQFPELATQQEVEFFENNINRCADILQRAGLGSYELTRSQFNWRLQLARHYGAEPQELIEYLDLQTSQLLAAVTAEQSSSVARLRNMYLHDFAENAAKASDFTQAKLFLSQIDSDAAQETALQSVLAEATNLTQIDTIKPDELTLQFNPELGMQFKAAEALAQDNLAKLSNTALELARTIADGDEYTRMDNIEELVRKVSSKDSQRGLDLTIDVLHELRTAKLSASFTKNLSCNLIAADDPQEPILRRKEIEQRSSSQSFRLLHLWDLAKTLEML